jgi:hypothetical protein
MVEALMTLTPPSSFLLDRFFRGPVIESPTDSIQIDIQKRKRRLAPFVSPLSAAKAEPRAGYASVLYTPPYVKPMRESSAANYFIRNPGENPYSGISIMDRGADLMIKDFAEMNEEIDRTEAWLAAQQLAEGVVTIVGEGVGATIDFQRSATHNIASTALAGGAGWNGAGAKPLTDFRTAKLLALKDSGYVVNTAVFGTTAWEDFIGNTEVQKYLNQLHLVPGTVTPTSAIVGGQYMGTIEGVDLIVYVDWYLNDAGVEQPMLPEDYVILGSTETRAERSYGAIQDDDAMFPARRWPLSWKEHNPPIRYVMLQSAPLPVAHEPDAFVRLDTRA